MDICGISILSIYFPIGVKIFSDKEVPSFIDSVDAFDSVGVEPASRAHGWYMEV